MILGTRNPEKSLCHIFGTILSHLPNVPKIGQSGVADKCVKMYSFLSARRLFTKRYIKRKEGKSFDFPSMRKVRDSNPRYDVMRTPHFECGSFDHSDNFPTFVSRSSAVPLFTENASKRKRVQRYGFFFKHPNVLHIFCDFSALLGAMRVN